MRMARAFKVWQRSLLDRYLDLLSRRMRDAKKSVLIQRFKIIAKKCKAKLRMVFKKWQTRARLRTWKMLHSSHHHPMHMGLLALANLSIQYKKRAMNPYLASSSLKFAFHTWKNQSLDRTYLEQQRFVSLSNL
jgi:hypothetical protein